MYSEIRDEFYSTYSEVMQELQLRKDNVQLQAAVIEYLGDDFPEFMNKNDQKSVFARCIHTPNYEHFFLRDVLMEFNLAPVFCNYNSGKLVMKNSEKYHLSKMKFIEGFDSKKRIIHSCKNIININTNEGKCMKDIVVDSSHTLVEFHDNLFKKLGYKDTFFDMSSWFNKVREDDGYYCKFLALFLCHGVLFDNYLLGDEKENIFFHEKILPSFNFLKEKFGVKPLIFPALPIKEENNALYFFYDSRIKNLIKEDHDL